MKGKQEFKPQKTSGGSGISADHDEITTNLRIQLENVISGKLTLRTRFEYAGYSFNGIHENGFLFFQDLVYTPKLKFSLYLRYARFRTDGYNSRIYTFENDLLYTFSIPEFHGNGHRVYLNLKWSPASNVSVYLKTGCTIHEGVSSWGSGNDVTSGNKRIELRGQLYFRF